MLCTLAVESAIPVAWVQLVEAVVVALRLEGAITITVTIEAERSSQFLRVYAPSTTPDEGRHCAIYDFVVFSA